MDVTLAIYLSFALAIFLGVLIGFVLFSPITMDCKKVSKDTFAGSIVKYLTELLRNKETFFRKGRMSLKEVKFNFFGIVSITFARKEDEPLKDKNNNESRNDS